MYLLIGSSLEPQNQHTVARAFVSTESTLGRFHLLPPSLRLYFDRPHSSLFSSVSVILITTLLTNQHSFPPRRELPCSPTPFITFLTLRRSLPTACSHTAQLADSMSILLDEFNGVDEDSRAHQLANARKKVSRHDVKGFPELMPAEDLPSG